MKPRSEARQRLEALIEEIATTREGAFAPFSRNAILRAFLLPSGGLGVWALFEVYAKL